MDRSHLQEWLINALETSGKGEGELARHLRLPGSAISRMKKGTRNITASEMFKIADFLTTDLPKYRSTAVETDLSWVLFPIEIRKGCVVRIHMPSKLSQDEAGKIARVVMAFSEPPSK